MHALMISTICTNYQLHEKPLSNALSMWAHSQNRKLASEWESDDQLISFFSRTEICIGN